MTLLPSRNGENVTIKLWHGPVALEIREDLASLRTFADKLDREIQGAEQEAWAREENARVAYMASRGVRKVADVSLPDIAPGRPQDQR